MRKAEIYCPRSVCIVGTKTRERIDWQLANSDRSGDARKATAWQSPFSWQVKNEYLTYEDIYKGIHDDKNNVCL